jgi:hypothetical protein
MLPPANLAPMQSPLFWANFFWDDEGPEEREPSDETIAWALPSERTMARALRRLLKRAGITRDELFEASPTRKPITWHDARATGITWLAIEGLDPAKIQRRAGHSTVETTMGYIREAESFAGEAFGTPFPPLPLALLGGTPGVLLAAANPSNLVAAGSVDGTSWRGGRDSNPGSGDGGVEDALAFALRGAASAGEWAVVAQLARELEARRLARGSAT